MDMIWSCDLIWKSGFISHPPPCLSKGRNQSSFHKYITFRAKRSTYDLAKITCVWSCRRHVWYQTPATLETWKQSTIIVCLRNTMVFCWSYFLPSFTVQTKQRAAAFCCLWQNYSVYPSWTRLCRWSAEWIPLHHWLVMITYDSRPSFSTTSRTKRWRACLRTSFWWTVQAKTWSRSSIVYGPSKRTTKRTSLRSLCTIWIWTRWRAQFLTWTRYKIHKTRR